MGPYRRPPRSVAVHGEHLARDVARFVGCEERHHIGDFLGRPHPTERGEADEAVLDLLRQPCRQIGGMRPGDTALTAMFRPPYSFAIALVKPMMPAFAAA